MASPKQDTIVTRSYQAASDECARALEFLLKTPLRKEGDPDVTAPDSAKGGSGDSSAETFIPKDP